MEVGALDSLGIVLGKWVLEYGKLIGSDGDEGMEGCWLGLFVGSCDRLSSSVGDAVGNDIIGRDDGTAANEGRLDSWGVAGGSVVNSKGTTVCIRCFFRSRPRTDTMTVRNNIIHTNG